MSGYLFLLLLGYIGYRVSKRAARKRGGRDWTSGLRPGPASPSPVTRAQLRGDAGEAQVLAELHRVLTWLCGSDFYVHDGAVLLHHAPGTAFPTAEIDHLAVTPFGIFVIETKNWTGSIVPGNDPDELIRIGSDGTREPRRSPLAQNRTKVGFLNDKLPRVWPIEGLGVFAAADSTLHPDLPLSLIHLGELAHWLRLRRQQFEVSGRKQINVGVAWQAIMLNASIDPAQLEEHRKRVSGMCRHSKVSRGNTD